MTNRQIERINLPGRSMLLHWRSSTCVSSLLNQDAKVVPFCDMPFLLLTLSALVFHLRLFLVFHSYLFISLSLKCSQRVD